jgi:hypothetical protein
LSQGVRFSWLPEHEIEFQAVKANLSNIILRQYFDRKLKTELICDASRTKGFGWILVQIRGYDSAGEKLYNVIACGSKSLTRGQHNWSMVELESQALKIGSMGAAHWLKGGHYDILTDHKPLLSLYNDQRLELIKNVAFEMPEHRS